ncbi:hypothetical protein FQR65_LT14979 [Abscondita terminalis]|nr:hypothetical protein FQR65_LT14979 [Abscondita terminalis]
MSESGVPDDGDLIEQVRAYSLIYDKRHKFHKDASAIQNAWESIASILNSSPAECQRRWQILRTRYNAKAKKITCIPSGSSADEIVTGIYFKDLLFLKDYIQQSRTKSNVKQQEIFKVWDPLHIITENREEDGGSTPSTSGMVTPDACMVTPEAAVATSDVKSVQHDIRTIERTPRTFTQKKGGKMN